jgi:glucokinase
MATGMLAVDFGGTRMRVAAFDTSGKVVHKQVIATPRGEPAALARTMREVADAGGLAIEGAVVGVPGPVNYDAGTVVRLPNLPDWEGTISARALSQAVQMPVKLANDADLAALGEHRFGAGRGTSDMVYVTSSTGVGAGVIIKNRLLRGRLSLAEAGHMIIEREGGGTLEGLGSGTALERITGSKGADVTRRALGGDKAALRALRDVADALAVGVFNLVHCFMPERVVIGGGVSQAGDLLLEPVRERLRACGAACSASACDVFVAAGGDDVGLLGAFALWQEPIAPE